MDAIRCLDGLAKGIVIGVGVWVFEGEGCAWLRGLGCEAGWHGVGLVLIFVTGGVGFCSYCLRVGARGWW